MTPLNRIKLAAIAYVDAKRSMEAYAGACVAPGPKLDPQQLAALTAKWRGAEMELEAAVLAGAGAKG